MDLEELNFQNLQNVNLCCINVADLLWTFRVEFSGEDDIHNKPQVLQILLRIGILKLGTH